MQAFVVVATIGTLFLLASSLPVKANGAWLLWQGSQKLNKAEGVEKYLVNEANINWILLSGHDTKSTCVKFALDPLKLGGLLGIGRFQMQVVELHGHAVSPVVWSS